MKFKTIMVINIIIILFITLITLSSWYFINWSTMPLLMYIMIGLNIASVVYIYLVIRILFSNTKGELE